MRLIDADALIEEALTAGAYGYVDAKQIADAPTVDTAPVQHGHWIIGTDNDDFDVKCSNVNGLISLKSPELPLWKESLKPCIIARTAVLEWMR